MLSRRILELLARMNRSISAQLPNSRLKRYHNTMGKTAYLHTASEEKLSLLSNSSLDGKKDP